MAGKGSKPRSCFSKRFKQNFDEIIWDAKKELEVRNYTIKKNKKIYKYHEKF